MERVTESREPVVAGFAMRKPDRPWVMLVATVFLGFASFVALPLLVLSPKPVPWAATALISASGLAAIGLLALARNRVTFELTRVVLGAWAARGVYAVFTQVAHPAPMATADPMPLINQIILACGVGGLFSLFAIFGFGRGTRAFYRL